MPESDLYYSMADVKNRWLFVMKNALTLFCLLLCPALLLAQEATEDTATLTLSTVTVKGFETNLRLLEAPATINILNQKSIQRFAATSLVPVMNTLPGIRMEERSPGSYRLSIRGSLLRSPFGIRNIKVYIDDMPFTDAGGNTYFNLIEPVSIGSIEVLKGPAGSLYGAGTGGAVILNSPGLQPVNEKKASDIKVQLQGGSYGLLGQNISWRVKQKKYGFQLTQSHMQCDGYRDNSRMRKDVIHFANTWAITPKDDLKIQLLLADLFYQTPGGLTQTQFETNPKQARPATATLPGATQQKAAVYNKTAFAGLSNKWQLSNKWSNSMSAVFSYTNFKNPFITNYEKRKETSLGLRTTMAYTVLDKAIGLKLLGGAEWQNTFAIINNYGNKNGEADTVQSKDEVNALQRFYFAQADLAIKKKVFINAGASINQFAYRYIRTTDNPSIRKVKNFDAVVLPRLAVSFLPVPAFSVRAIVSKGFSVPTIAELRPSEGSFYESLQAEHGWNYEAGIRGALWGNRIQFDVNTYIFNLANAIVRRTTANGAEYFINAGGTKQKGIEAMLLFVLARDKQKFISGCRVGSSVTVNQYRFKNYSVGNENYSGNKLTGVPDKIIVSTLDVEFKNNFQLYITHNYTSGLPLSDANIFFAKAYHLLQCKLVHKLKTKTPAIEIFAGADNILNGQYSLGNDLNAAGNRFYNAAPLSNYFAGISFAFGK